MYFGNSVVWNIFSCAFEHKIVENNEKFKELGKSAHMSWSIWGGLNRIIKS